MGLGGIGVWQLLIVLAIVVMLFGTSRLRSIGGDMGSAIKGFRNAMQDPDKDDNAASENVADDVAGIGATRKESRPT